MWPLHAACFRVGLTTNRKSLAREGELTLWVVPKREDNPQRLCQHECLSLDVVLV